MKMTYLKDLPKVEPRESKFSIDEIIDLSSRKDKNVNRDQEEYIEIFLCLANKIKKLQKSSCRCKTCANYKKRVRRSPYALGK